MGKVLVYVMLLMSVLFATEKHDEVFKQEVVKVFTSKDGLPETSIDKIILTDQGDPIAVTKIGSYVFKKEKWIRQDNAILDQSLMRKKNMPADAGEIYTWIRYDDKKVVGTENGLYIYDNEWQRILPADDNYSWALTNVKVLKEDSKGRLWIGSDQGIGYLKNGKWHLFTGKEGLPYGKFTCIATSSDGNVWYGTEKGAFRADGTQFYYRFSRRWLADDYVNDIVVDKNENIWIATRKGISRISFIPMTFDDKAVYFTKQVETRHNRMGFICQNHLKEQYNSDSWMPAISDNDGMYTAMYGAAMAFQYAVTGDSVAKKIAKRSFEACKWLVDITHEPGFPARVIIPVDWPEPVNEQYGHEYNKNKQKGDPFWKDIYPRFPLSEDGKYRWKCDTSSDELAGHYFFYGVYYDLVAETEEEKKPVREVVAAITDHMIRHGFVLLDHDGKPTRWANFSPEFFNSVWGWDQRGLNSMMMLSFLSVTGHITGDPKYAEVAKELREKYDYHINTMQSKMFFPPEDVVPWDNNLCLMSWYGLLNYEDDPELILMYRESLENAWLQISRQKNAFWNVIYAALASRFNKLADSGTYSSGKYFIESPLYASFTAQEFYKEDYRREDVLETLKIMPLDLIGYHMDNTHRLDIVLDPTPGQAPGMGWHVDGGALRIDERGHVRQDRDGFAIDYSEGNGWSEQEGTFYLLPYWMARYHGVIQ